MTEDELMDGIIEAIKLEPPDDIVIKDVGDRVIIIKGYLVNVLDHSNHVTSNRLNKDRIDWWYVTNTVSFSQEFIERGFFMDIEIYNPKINSYYYTHSKYVQLVEIN